jgi:peptide-methionine (S)-S-oxide reductase
MFDASEMPRPDGFPDPDLDVASRVGEQQAIFAGGCFWCVEAVFKPLNGVSEVTSGYAGGSADTADYRAVCSGSTDHAEAVRVHFDASRVTYGDLLRIFFSVAHDPTQLDRQGPDTGHQYRSSVFPVDEEQRQVAQAYIEQLDDAAIFPQPIVTTVEPLEKFFEAEEYHQDYAERNPGQAYIQYNTAPKVKKLYEYYADRLEDDSQG